MKTFIILLGLCLLIAGCHCRPGEVVEPPEGGEIDVPEISDGEGGEAHCLKAKISRKCQKGSGLIIFNDTE